MDRVISVANGTSSSLYGCIAENLKEYIIEKFPKDFFNYTSISSELSTRLIRRVLRANSRNEIAKRQRPCLYIQPTYSAMEPDGPLQGIPLTKNMNNIVYNTDTRYLFQVIQDNTLGYSLMFQMNRDRIDFEVTVAVDTLHLQLDLYRTLLNQIPWEISVAQSSALESIIPKSMIHLIGRYCDLDVSTHEEYIPILNQKMNKHSVYPINYKIRNASALDEWFMYYTHNIIITFTDLAVESNSKKYMADEEFRLTFKVSAEFNLPGMFYLLGAPEKLKGIDTSLIVLDTHGDTSAFYPLYSVRNFYNKYPSELNGMQFYGSSIFKVDPTPNIIEDRISLNTVIDADHIRAIKTHSSWNMRLETIMTMIILMNKEELSQDDFYLDVDTMEVVVTKINPEATYRFILYLNNNLINEMLINKEYDRVYDVNKLKENKFPDEGIRNDTIETYDGVTRDRINTEPFTPEKMLNTMGELEDDVPRKTPADIFNTSVTTPTKKFYSKKE